MSILKPLIVILGPTASGKSELALKLAKKFDSEIINADSRQIYKDMMIGTGSLLSENQNVKIKVQNDNVKYKNKIINYTIINAIPHHLFHFIMPNKKFSVAEYKDLTVKTIHDIQNRGKLPILTGGTGLYISSIVDNLEIPKAPPNNKIRTSLEKKTSAQLFRMLHKIDPGSASIIGPQNKRKIIRALEVFKVTGKPFSSQKIKGKPLFDILEIGIMTNREKLYKKIDDRVDKMIKRGLIKETENLIKKYSYRLPAMTGIGYKEIGQYLSKELPLSEAAQLIKFRTHQYARRQMTWFKRDERIAWINDFTEAKKVADKFLKSAKSKYQKSK